MLHELVDRASLRVNLTCMQVNEAPLPQTMGDLSSYGLRCRLSDTFNAPNCVKEYLCRSLALDRIYLGDANADRVRAMRGGAAALFMLRRASA